MAIHNRDYTAGRFLLEIDHQRDQTHVGYIKKFSGLNMVGDIVANDLGPDNIQMKHVANMKWAPAKATIGMGMGKSLYDWIQASFDKGYVQKNGMLTIADFDSNAVSEIEFSNALITHVGVPKLDGSSKESAYFDIEFDAESVAWKKPKPYKIGGSTGKNTQKAWLCSNFRVEIEEPGGRPLPCDRVASVDAFAWKCAVLPNQVGIRRVPTKHPAKVTVPDLKLAISNADFDDWAKIAHRWFIDGQHREQHHLTGRIVFLGPNMHDELGWIDLMGVGFKQISQDDGEANSERIKRFTCELYVEKMKFFLKEYDA